MSRCYSSHEHTRKIRTRPDQPTDLEKGILARMHTTVLEGETRYFNYTSREREGDPRFPVGTRIDLRLLTKRGVNHGIPFPEVGGWRDLTLIEKPQTNRLRILWQGGWWIEVQLAPFYHLLELAAMNYGEVLPPLTTVAVTAELVQRLTAIKPVEV